MNEVKVNLLPYSQHKFASNVVEKCLQVCLLSICCGTWWYIQICVYVYVYVYIYRHTTMWCLL